VAALIPMIEGAGGIVTDRRGQKPQLGRQIVGSANQRILDEALISLRRSAE
jgi:fructose-1,6-bisphosphatase/inositol monophosphatase family enzyme